MDATEIAGQWSDEFETSIRKESPRAKVVLSAAFLDRLLRDLLKTVLKPISTATDPLLDGPSAPLGSFSARIDMSCRLGLLADEVGRALHYVRRIRNRFAHEIQSCSINDDQIMAWIAELDALTNIATSERRRSFSDGPMGDFEKGVSWLIFWIKLQIQSVPSECPACGTAMAHRERLKRAMPRTP